jgi:hypothetical protein
VDVAEQGINGIGAIIFIASVRVHRGNGGARSDTIKAWKSEGCDCWGFGIKLNRVNTL